MNHSPQRIAVIGGGISGLASAWLLRQQHRVTLFESEPILGGHTHTVDVTVDGHTHPVDTGFLVYNERTYPNLIALFKHLDVPSVETEMSFSVRLDDPDLEWAGTDLGTVFGQKRNLGRRDFWRMLRDLLRFNRESTAWLQRHGDGPGTLRDFLRAGGYSDAFAHWYLLPMAAAIWSCPTGQMLDTPLSTFVRFCHNHGLLQIFNRPTWRTVRGGGREYVRRMAAQLGDVRTACPVHAVTREGSTLRVRHAQGEDTFDQVIVACHSDQALTLLGDTASAEQRDVLRAVRYQPNRAVLHTDPALLPRRRTLWAAWNYHAGRGDPGQQPVGVSYLINRLQPLPFTTPVVVTLNPTHEPAPEHLIAEYHYAHPIFDGPAIAAQQVLRDPGRGVQGAGGVWLAGAWSGYGFHEDGLSSAVRVAQALGVSPPWAVPTRAEDPSVASIRTPNSDPVSVPATTGSQPGSNRLQPVQP